MKKRVLRYLMHIVCTLLVLTAVAVLILLKEDGGIHYGDNAKKMDWDKDGPYVFYQDSLLEINYIRGNQKDGFFIDQKIYNSQSTTDVKCHFALDSTHFQFSIQSNFETPEVSYEDSNKILAISDIESGYRTFRDFLISNHVIDGNLNWIFGKGHLVLVGDFVDRGFSTTQVLWFIYKLENDAKKHGGNVHFILGNHELKVLQGNYEASSPKYFYLASIMERQQHELYSNNSFLGRWMASKNTMEIINGHLFVHGGIHPEIGEIKLNLEEINQYVRDNYLKAYYPKKEKSTNQILTSTYKGPSWYRGYFRDDLSQSEIEIGLNKFNAKAVIVGHTIQSKINKSYNGKVIGIDVQHPKDYHENWPNRHSEALFIENGRYYRVYHDGQMEEI